VSGLKEIKFAEKPMFARVCAIFNVVCDFS